MKHGTLIMLGLLVAFQVGWTKENTIHVRAVNPLTLERKSETLAIRLDDIKKHLPSVIVEQLVVVDEKTQAELLSQVTSKELLFQSDFKANEKKSFIIKQSPTTKGNVQSLVDGRFFPPREDYAWENDRIAFRMYGPALAKEVDSGIDVWTKRVRSLVVAKWYKGDEDTGKARISYHIDHGEGADFFSVGRTLGAGGSGIWHNGKVCQPGVFATQKTIANGPIRQTFELAYNWNVDGKKFTEVKRISLDAGKNLNAIEVSFVGELLANPLEIACGLVKRKNTMPYKDKKNYWISLWGRTDDDTTNGSLGTGVVMGKSSFAAMNEDSVQYLIIGKAATGKAFTYYSGAGWTRSGDFASAEDWNNYLSTFAQQLQSPLKISLTGK